MTEQEQEFFAAIDRNSEFEGRIFDQIQSFTDGDYYNLRELHIEHTCGVAPATIQIYAERAGTLYRCTRCGQTGIIGG